MTTRTESPALGLRGAELRDRVLRAAPLPTPTPVGARAVGELPARPRAAEVVAAAARDPVLGAALLSTAANARDYDGCSLGEAVARLGPGDAAQALRDAAARTPRDAAPFDALARRCWRESLMVARVAQALCRLRKLDPYRGYSGGLVHDLGKCVAVAALRERGHDGSAEGAWDGAVDALHVEAGIRHAAQVGMPSDVRRILATHHDLGATAVGAEPVLATVATADAVVERFGSTVGTTERDLEAIAGLRTPAERIVTARILPGVAAAVDEVEQQAARPAGPHRLSIVAPGGVRVTVDLGRERIPCAGERFEERRLTVTAPLPLPGGKVLLATILDEASPFAIWVSVARTWGDRAGWHSELEVVAVWGGATDTWRSFLDRHGPTAPTDDTAG